MNRKHSRHDTFCREYMKDLNGTRAAIAAGYSAKTASVTASQLLSNPKVKARLAKLMEKQAIKLDLSAEKVLSELARMGFANFCDYLRTTEEGDISVDLSRVTREQAAAIQEVIVDEYMEGRGKKAGKVKRTRVKLADKNRSLELLGKYFKMFTYRMEISGGQDLAEKIAAARRRERARIEHKAKPVLSRHLRSLRP